MYCLLLGNYQTNIGLICTSSFPSIGVGRVGLSRFSSKTVIYLLLDPPKRQPLPLPLLFLKTVFSESCWKKQSKKVHSFI